MALSVPSGDGRCRTGRYLPGRVVRCRWCQWTTSIYSKKGQYSPGNAYERLTDHVSNTHPDQYDEIDEREMEWESSLGVEVAGDWLGEIVWEEDEG